MKRSSIVSLWLAHRALPAIVSIIAIAFAVIGCFLIQIAATLDHRSAEREAAFVDAMIETQRAEMGRTAKDYAAWGEAYRNLHPVVNLDWAYEAENAGPTLFSDFGFNYLIVIGPSDATHYAVVDGELADRPAEDLLTGGLAALIARARESGTETVPVHGVLMAEGQAVLTTAAVLSPAQDPNVPSVPGPTSVLVLGYKLTPEKLAATGKHFFVSGLRKAKNSTDAAGFGKSLTSEDGSLSATLTWTPERSGRDLLRRVLPWLGGAAALFVLLTFLVFWHIHRSARLLDHNARKLAAANAKAEHQAMHDVITGLPNRAMAMNRLDEILARIGSRRTALFYLDLDRFKPVNDALGHFAGDQVLVDLSRRLKTELREVELVARVGGDEFVAVAPAASAAAAEAICRDLIEMVTRPFSVDGDEVEVGVSIGIAMAPEDADGAAELLRRAGIALDQAKQERQGSYCFYASEMNEAVLARRALETDLRRAIENGEFELYFQPRFETATCHIASVEALLRWNHPERGLTSPGAFVPLAEETGLIVQIGEWALREACSIIARHDKVRVSVNLSPVQFRNDDLIGTVKEALEASGLPPHRLELELTENVLVDNTGSALRILQQLKRLGVDLAMDDFGTGYSSLSYLQTFPFDRLKIDQTFVARLSASGGSRPIVQAILGLGRSLGISVTAEGVETPEQFLLLRTDNCAEVQGFLLASPMPASELAKVLARSPEEIRRIIAA